MIQNLPDRYETEIAERGATLSAGQRQRMAIARALIRNTPIVILDEATANIDVVDVETEMRLLKALFAELKGKTVIFVSHRLASASLADQICVIHNGKIVEYGTHEELMCKGNLYTRMQEANRSIEKQKVNVAYKVLKHFV